MITVTVTNGITRISGKIGNNEIIAVSNAITVNEWHVATSCALPSDIRMAAEYVRIYSEVFQQIPAE